MKVDLAILYSPQVVKNQIFVTRCARLLETKGDNSAESDDKDVVRLSVLWLVRKMTREAHHESLFNNKVTLKVHTTAAMGVTAVTRLVTFTIYSIEVHVNCPRQTA